MRVAAMTELASAIVGQPAPDIVLECIDASQSPVRRVHRSEYHGRWLVLIFYPHDFSLVCPTELTAFSGRAAEFRTRDCDLLAVSVDTIDLHRQWLTTSPVLGGIGALQFPLAADPRGEAAKAFGSWNQEKQLATRGLFIIDPQGVLQYSVVHNL